LMVVCNGNVFIVSMQTMLRMSVDDDVREMLGLYSQGNVSALGNPDYSEPARRRFTDQFISAGRFDEISSFGKLHRFNDYVIQFFAKAGMTEMFEFYLVYRQDDPALCEDQRARSSSAVLEGDYAGACRAALESYSFTREYLRTEFNRRLRTAFESATDEKDARKMILENILNYIPSFARVSDIALAGKDNLDEKQDVYRISVLYDAELLKMGLFAHDSITRSFPEAFMLSTYLNQFLLDHEARSDGEEVAEHNMHDRSRVRIETELSMLPEDALEQRMGAYQKLAVINRKLGNVRESSVAYEHWEKIFDVHNRMIKQSVLSQIQSSPDQNGEPSKLLLPGQREFDETLSRGTQQMRHEIIANSGGRNKKKERTASEILADEMKDR